MHRILIMLPVINTCGIMSEKTDLFSTAVVEIEKREYNHPIIIGGFAGSTMAGLLSVGYLIEQLGMHQVAHVRSHYIPPVAVFVGNKLRHPFRIYSNKKGDTLAIISEVPISDLGLYEISASIIDWARSISASEIIILDGIPVDVIMETRKSYCIAESEELENCKKNGIPGAQSAIITGIGGSLLNECLVKGFKGSSLITPCSVDIPDPGSALSLIQAITLKTGIKVDTKLLQESVNKMHEEMSAVIKQYADAQAKKTGKPSEESMYR